jgi:hypothetical protein
MDKIIFLVSFFVVIAIITLFFLAFLRKVKDIYLVYTLAFSNFLFFDFLKLPIDPLLIISPCIFFLFFFKRNIGKSQIKNFRQNVWPFFILFVLTIYWYIQKGLLPNFLFSVNNYDISANFAYYLIMMCNFLILLTPFYLRLSVSQFDKILKNIMFLTIIQFTMIVISKGLNLGLYIPFLMPLPIIESSGASSILRDGLVSNYSYIIVLYGLFYLNSKYRLIVTIIVISCNLIIGGGRIDLIGSLLAIILFLIIIKRQKKSFRLPLSLVMFSIIGLITFSVITNYMSKDQKNRFSELVNLQEADELDASRDNVRAAMWLYAVNGFLESPLIGNGISNKKTSSFKNVAERNTSVGSSHQQYLSVLYVFGLLGFIPFLIGLRKIIKKLIWLRKRILNNRVYNFLFTYFIMVIFFNFNTGGAVNKLDFMFYFFAGYVFSISLQDFNKRIET